MGDSLASETGDTSSEQMGHKLYKDILKSPRHVVAPMVDQSELSWRILCRRYGAQLCYTPMFNARLFAESAKYRKDHFATDPEDRPLVVQFCANDPACLLKAARLVEGQCDAVDLNLGCPQDIARRGRYGSYLQDEWGLIYKLVSALKENLSIPVTVKIRVFPDVEKTLKYAEMIQSAGASLLAVHGRIREQRGHNTGLADWEQIRRVKEALKIPVLANGNILYHEDIESCISTTGADGVMSAEGNLYNPALFTPRLPFIWSVVEEYLDICRSTPTPPSIIKGHLFKLFKPCLQRYTALRERLGCAGDFSSLKDVSSSICSRLRSDYENRLSGDGDPDMGDLSTSYKTHEESGFKSIPHWRLQPHIRPEQAAKNNSYDKKRKCDLEASPCENTPPNKVNALVG